MSRPSIVWFVLGLATLVGCTSPGTDVINVEGDAAVVADRPPTPPGMDAAAPDVFIPPSADVAALDVRRDAGPNADAFWADNPPPRFCGPDGGMGTPATLPSGTAECPDDLLREGCPCTTIGEERPCWPGLRVNRNRGICRDGMTRCVMDNELGGRWSACEGYVLPQPGQRLGPASCQCFSQGQWEITNLSPCFITYPGGQVYAVSTYLDAMNQAHCPTNAGGPPPMPQPGTSFSTNFLTVDCSGRFRLCFTIKAGDAMRPGAGDCTLSQTCTEGWYATPGMRQAMPPLPAWSSTDPTCASRFVMTGGYGEMTVQGLSTECQAIDNGSGMPYAFLRVPYCPVRCSMNPSLPECAMCRNGGAGRF
jgi:hypothetical protein